MKKVKLLFAAVALVAVAGGAMAFKSKDAYGAKVYLKNTDGVCNVELLNFTTTSVQPAAPFDQLVDITITSGSPCITAYTTNRP